MLPVAAVLILSAELRIKAYDRLCRFHQQCSQESVPLLADRAHPLFPAQRVFSRNQTQVAADPLAALEPPHIINRENEGQRGYWTRSGLSHQQSDQRIGYCHIGYSLAQQLDLSFQGG